MDAREHEDGDDDGVCSSLIEDHSEENSELLNALKYSRKFEVWNKLSRRHSKPPATTKELLIRLQNSIYREYKPDLKEAVYLYDQSHSKSQPKLIIPQKQSKQATNNQQRMARTFTQDYEAPKTNENVFHFDLKEEIQPNRSQCDSFESESWCSEEDDLIGAQSTFDPF